MLLPPFTPLLVGRQSGVGRGLLGLLLPGLAAHELLGLPVSRRRVALAGHLGDQDVLVHIHDAGALLDVDRAVDGVGDLDDGLHHVADQRRLADRIVLRLAHQQLCLEGDEVDLVFQHVAAHLVGRMAAGEGVGVVLGRQPHHPHVHSLGQDHVDSAQRCVDTRRIAVVDHRDVLREALQQADLLGGERRAGRGHHVLHTGLVHGDHVRVTLHHDGYVLLLDGPLGEEEAVELVFLAVDDALGRVEVLAHVLVRAQNAAAEGDHSSRDVVHGEDHTVAEAVEERAVAVAADRESRIDQILLPIARLACGPREGRPCAEQ